MAPGKQRREEYGKYGKYDRGDARITSDVKKLKGPTCFLSAPRVQRREGAGGTTSPSRLCMLLRMQRIHAGHLLTSHSTYPHHVPVQAQEAKRWMER